MGAGGKHERCHFLGARRHRSAFSFSLFTIKASFAFWILFLSLNVFDSRYHLCVAADVVNGGVTDVDEPDVGDVGLIKAANVMHLVLPDTVGVTDQTTRTREFGHQLKGLGAADLQHRRPTPRRDIKGRLDVFR